LKYSHINIPSVRKYIAEKILNCTVQKCPLKDAALRAVSAGSMKYFDKEKEAIVTVDKPTSFTEKKLILSQEMSQQYHS
jgi:hypothetical protein